MDQTDEWLRRLNPPRRNHFFTGKMMGVAQFEREQRYGLGQRWLINRMTIGAGILCGLDAALTADGKRISVAPGVAVDCFGREIVVALPREYDPFAAPGGDCGCGGAAAVAAPGDYLVCLSYRECETDDQPAEPADDCGAGPDCQPDTTVETYALCLKPASAPPPGFDCATWTEPVALTSPPSALTSPPGTSPPGVALLRARLADMLAGPCAKGATSDGCVPLGRVTVTMALDGTLALVPGVSADPRVRIYTQAQMLDMILCLANCGCSGQAPPQQQQQQPPPVTPLFQVNAVEVVAQTPSLSPPAPGQDRYVTLAPVATAPWPVFWSGASGRPQTIPYAVRVTFNQGIDATSIPDPFTGSTNNSVALSLTVPASPLATAALRVVALREQPNQMILVAIGLADAGGVVLTNQVAFFGIKDVGGGGRGGGLMPPGIYQLTLFGDADSVHTPIMSWAHDDVATQRLDGEWTDPNRFPAPGEHSGTDNAPGGNFSVTFEIRETLRLNNVVTPAGFFYGGTDPISLQWIDGGMDLTFAFNKAFDPATIASGVSAKIKSDGTDLTQNNVTLDPADKTSVTITFGFPSPASKGGPYDVTVTLLGLAGGLAEPGGALFDGHSNATNDLPTGDGVPGGNYTFTLHVS
jgi:hypothetical protein